MAVLGQLLLLLLLSVAIPTALAVTRFSCDCLVSNSNYQQYHVACRHDPKGQESTTGQQVACGKPNLSCGKDVLGYVPDGYEYVVRGKLYKLYRTALTYDKATATCRRDGGNLAVPTTKSEADAIGDIIRRNPAVKQAFIGLTDINEEGTFATADGTPLSQLGYHEWAPGQPDNAQSAENCATINERGLYNDYHCDWAQNFVCQRPVSPEPPPGYRYLPQLGFYRHYTSPPVKFAEAKKRCFDDGGYLAVIETQKEAEELVKYFDDDKATTTESWIGLNDIDKEGVYVTETGKTLADLSFVNWGLTEPNNLGGENCIVFRIDGSYNDVQCDLSKSYFCEIPLPRKVTT